MSSPVFRDLQNALTSAPDWDAVRQVWQEGQLLARLLKDALPAGLIRQVVRVRRSDPPRGVRGTEITVLARHASAAAKLRLALADWPAALRAQGLGIQTVRVTAERVQPIGEARRVVAPRDPIPQSTRQQFLVLAQGAQSEALKKALKRISR